MAVVWVNSRGAHLYEYATVTVSIEDHQGKVLAAREYDSFDELDRVAFDAVTGEIHWMTIRDQQRVMRQRVDPAVRCSNDSVMFTISPPPFNDPF